MRNLKSSVLAAALLQRRGKSWLNRVLRAGLNLKPHQGLRECLRRAAQLERGLIHNHRVHNTAPTE